MEKKWTVRELEEKFPIGSVITITFDTRRCVVYVEKYAVITYGEVVAQGIGINADNELLRTNFGTEGNNIRFTTFKDLLNVDEYTRGRFTALVVEKCNKN